MGTPVPDVNNGDPVDASWGDAVRTAVTELQHGAGNSGGAFPLAPAVNDVFFRTDLHIEFYWSGVYWLSTQLYTEPIPNTDALMPFTASTGQPQRAGRPLLALAGIDIYVVSFSCIYFVIAATALGAAHKWVTVLSARAPAGSPAPNPAVLATLNLDNGANGWRALTANVNALLAAAMLMVDVQHTKTGTPGDLAPALPRWSYRLRAV